MSIRERFESLTRDEQDRVALILAPDVMAGWIPKEADVEAAIAAAVAASRLDVPSPRRNEQRTDSEEPVRQ